MTETTRKFPQTPDHALAQTLLGKRDALLAERAKIVEQQAQLASRDRQIDRELADCQAAGRVFGIDVAVPREQVQSTHLDAVARAIRQTEQIFNAQAAVARRASMQPLERAAQFAMQENAAKAAAVTAAVKAATTKAEMPRVSDIVLDRLKEAGKQGSKAAPIREYIERTYHKVIHDKTVGMTLYRLLKAGAVRRDGHTWFIADKAMNPGAGAPGQKDLLS